ncbi:hypothetical protein BC628DRAFT_126666 [Trametes gibbosa]|nr:hypothetical protein BC628DRAFT_126666 [Trametes gibbosa]
MHQKFIVVSTDMFMEKYVPPLSDPALQRVSATDTILKDVPVQSGSEVKMYEPLVKALTDAGICPKFKFAITASRGDIADPSKEAPDIGLYPSRLTPHAVEGPDGKIHAPATNWSAVELCIECKTSSAAHDPFDETELDNEPDTNMRKAVLGQILSYAEFILKRQQRMWVFMVLILGSQCRLLRFDRAGVIASQKFDYKTRGGTLIEFLWRYARWPAASTRGHDPTATYISPTSPTGKKMRRRATQNKDETKPEDYVRRLFEESLDVRWPWWKLRVEGKGLKGKVWVRFFLVGKPNFFASGVAGRGTKGFIAVDANNIDGPFYYLKDAWRVIGLDIDMEGNILQYLNNKAVEYIPTLECHGDVGGRKKQMTETDALWAEINEKEGGEDEKEEDDDNNKKDLISPFKTHRHYRIVVKEVGQPMSEFTSSRQLVHVLRCCILAHKEAYEANVIHRDVSAGNVLLYYDKKAKQWCGLLNDWEMSKRTDLPDKGRQLDRTGTWQFMSAMALMTPGKEIKVADELESFFHVLLYFAIRFVYHNCENVVDFMHEYFDTHNDISASEDQNKTKDTEEMGLLTFCWPSTTGSLLPLPHPLNTVITTFLQWTKARYSLLKPKASLPGHSTLENLPPTNQDKIVLRSYNGTSQFSSSNRLKEAAARKLAEDEAQNIHDHTPFSDLLGAVIHGDYGEWPLADKTEDQLPKEGYKRDADLKRPANDHAKSGSMLGGIPQPLGKGSSQKRPVAAVEEPEVAGPSKNEKSLSLRRSTRTKRSRK